MRFDFLRIYQRGDLVGAEWCEAQACCVECGLSLYIDFLDVLVTDNGLYLGVAIVDY